MSIEETNKLRASLNLPPLEIDKNDEKPSQSGDEISLSVEDTNKLRAKLGLPPLETDPQSAPQTDSKGTVIIDMDKQRREAEIRAKLEKSRQARERMELHHLKGQGLGAMLEAEYHDMDVKKWVIFGISLNHSCPKAQRSRRRQWRRWRWRRRRRKQRGSTRRRRCRSRWKG